MKHTRAFLALAIVVSVLTAGISTASAQAHARITGRIDESELVRLSGNTPPPAQNHANDRGAVSDSLEADHMFLQLQRSPEQEQQLNQLLEKLNDRKSPKFHHWLTPEQYGRRFGVAQADIDKIVGWLQSHGFRMNRVYPNKMLIDFSGTARSVREAFHTEIHSLDVNGERHLANVGDPLIPAALASVVKGPVSLHDFRPKPQFRVKGDYSYYNGTSFTHLITPQDDATIYHLNPLWSSGYSGLGQTIYVVEDSDFNTASDWATYRSTFGLNSFPGTLTQTNPGGCTDPGSNFNATEAEIDAEMATTVAPSAAINLLSCSATTFSDGTYIAISNLINDASSTVGVISMSYSLCEVLAGNGGTAGLSALFQQASAEGYSAFVSTGDSGAGGCVDNEVNFAGTADTVSLGVNGWGSTPYNVAVGGTDFEDTFNAAVPNVAEGGSIVPVKTYWKDGQLVPFNAFITEGSPTISTAGIIGGLSFSPSDNHDAISGTGLPVGTYIKSVQSSTSATMSANATGSGGGSFTLVAGVNSYGSALSYVPEIPWNDSCASALLSDFLTGSYTPYGSSPATCNNSSFDTTATYLTTSAAGSGASNCAAGTGATINSDSDTEPSCQGWPKPPFQTGSSLSGGSAVYGQPSDGVRDLPDVSMFAGDGAWGHSQIICFTGTVNSTSYACTQAPSAWLGIGGTSVAAPTMAGIQALVNQRTGENWGNPLNLYYQMGQNEYGNAGGSFNGSACNSSGSGGPASSCVFNDVTQGDNDIVCKNGSFESACYLPSNTFGATSTEAVTAATVINGGAGYSSAPNCIIAGPSNNNAYTSPSNTTLYSGGAQATCTASVASGSTTALWDVYLSRNPQNSWAGTEFTIAGTTYTFVNGAPTAANEVELYVFTGNNVTNETDTVKNFEAVINANPAQCASSGCVYSGQTANSMAVASASQNELILTAVQPGYAGNFYVTFGDNSSGAGNDSQPIDFFVTNATPGQGPNYVSAVTVTSAGSGYGPDTPVTFTGGGGSGAIGVTSNSHLTLAPDYEPAYPAAPGWDMATGLGTVNAYNFVNSSVWLAGTTTTVGSSVNPSTSGSSVSFTATIAATNNSITQSAPTGTVQFSIDGSAFGSPVSVSSGSATSGSTSTLSVGPHTVTATYSGDNANGGSTGTLSGGQVVNSDTTTTTISSSLNPSNYGQSVTLTATVTGPQNGYLPSGTVQFTANGSNLGSPVNVFTVQTYSTSTYTTTTLPAGTNTIAAVYSGDSNFPGSTGTLNGGQVVNGASQTITCGTAPPASEVYNGNFGVSCTASSGLDVALTWSGSACATGSATNTASITMTSGTGSCVVDANQAGNTNYSAAPQVSYTVNATLAQQIWYDLSNPPNQPLDAAYGAAFFTVAGTTTYEVAPVYTASGVCSNGPTTEQIQSGIPVWSSTYTMTSGTGTCTIGVSVPGNNNYAAFGPISLLPVTTATKATNTVAFTTSPPAAAEYGSSFMVAASGLGTGAITYTSSGACSNSGATYTMTSGTGSCSVTATQSADSNYQLASASASVTAEPAVANVSVALTTGTNPSNYGESLTFTASLTTDTGAVKFRKSNLRVKSQDVSGTISWSANTGCSASTVSGTPPQTATCTTTSLPIGTDNVVATYTANDGNHNTNVTGSVMQTVNSNTNTVTFTTPPPAMAEYGSSFMVAASGLGTGAITYSSSGACSNSGATYTMIAGIGTCTVTATQAADSNYPLASASASVMAEPAVASISVTSSSTNNTSTYGTSVIFTATLTTDTGAVKRRKSNLRVRSQDVSGAISWSANTGCSTSAVSGGSPQTATCTTTSLAAGSDTVTATYTASDGNHNATTSGSVSQTVNQASQTINVTTPAPAQVVRGSSFTVVASASSGLAVSFATSGACTHSGGTITMSNTASGTCTITISQSGNSDYMAASPVTETTTIEPAQTPTVSFTGAPGNAPYQSGFTVTATTNASTTAVITATPSTVCAVSGNTVTMLNGTGTCTMKASWAADDVYKAATATQTTKAGKIAPTVTFTGAPASAAYQTMFTVSASTTASTTATITAAPAAVCTISSGVVTMTSGTGVCTTTAKWATDSNYLAATLTQTTNGTELGSSVTWPAPSPITYGTTLSGVLDATANVAGKFTYTANGNTVTATTILPAGNYTMGVTFAPTANKDYSTATASVSLAVNPINTTTTVTKAAAASKTAPLALTVNFTVANGLTAAHDATGTVTVTASSGETCTGALTSGKGSCILTTAVAESGTLTAIYSGDGNNNGSASASFSFTD